MKKIVWIALATLVMVMTFYSCGTQQTTTQPTPTPAASDSVVAVTPMADVVSVVEALDMFNHPEKVAPITKKYGYKLKNNYEVYRLDKFSKMYYKNCSLAKLLTADKYEDYPKALIIAVFNQSAYDNLVAQVKAAGFKLDMPGSEDIYTNGTRTIACYKDGKSIRIQ